MWNFLFGGKDIICLCVQNNRRYNDHNSVTTTCQRASWQDISMTKPPVLMTDMGCAEDNTGCTRSELLSFLFPLQLRAVVVVTVQLSVRVGVWYCGEHHIIRANIRRSYRYCCCCCCYRCCSSLKKTQCKIRFTYQSECVCKNVKR